MEPIRATARIGIDQCRLQVVFAQKPIERAHRSCRPLRAAIRPPRSKAGRNRCRGLDRLLIERFRFLAVLAEALGPDGSEASRRRGLERHEPTQRLQASFDVGWRVGRQARLDQRLGKARVVVGEHVFEPEPVLGFLAASMDINLSARSPRMRLATRSPPISVAIGVQPQQREGPGARRREVLDDGKRRLEERGSPSAARWIGVVACAFAQCPKRPPVTVLRARVFQPSAVVAHEIAEPTRVWVPGVLDEGRKACGERLGQLRFARARKRAREQQGASVVVDTVAVGAVRHGMDGVLEHARAVAEREEMTESGPPEARVPCSGKQFDRPGAILQAGRARAPSRSSRDSAWPFAPTSSIGSPHTRVCAWHGGGRRLSAGRRSRCSWLWHLAKGTRMPRPSPSSSLACQ